MNYENLSVAVVNGASGRVAVWHVATEPIVQTSRLCGAWIASDAQGQRGVVESRLAVVSDAPCESVRTLVSYANGVIDIEATLSAIQRYLDELDEVHRASLTPKGSKRAPISWPALPEAPDWNSPPSVPAGVMNDPLIRSTIGIARWIADLADTWSAIESIRGSKAHLAESIPAPHPLPFVLKMGRKI